jgi:predicted transcriptional regulator
MTSTQESDLLPLVAEIVCAFVSHNEIPAADLPEVIRSTYTALTRAGAARELYHLAKPKSAVPINKSIRPDFLVCLEDGRRFKTLKRHLSTAYGLTLQLYRERWGLPPDYPMVAPNHSRRRSIQVEMTGLGIKTMNLVEPPQPKIQIVPEGVSGLKRTSKRAA